ncbi:MAG: secretin N-terminal domain-containing protein, partial [Candidatus Riflebacteria bacterium]|nr:secretin N-terminal domain-containing protein [Candidatus Riflebacteria bacterium]
MNRRGSSIFLAGIGWVIITGLTGSPLYAGNNAGWQPLRATTRGAISHPSSPTAGNSFYPTIRAPQTQSLRAGGSDAAGKSWVNLGNGARMKLPDSQDADNNKLSPEVLETIRLLKEQSPEPRYQLAAPSPVTGNVQNSLVPPANSASPAASEPEGQHEIGLQSTYLTFPRDKNIRISSLDFRQTDVSDALRSLAQLISINLMLSQDINGQVTILFNDVTIEEAFNTLLSSFNLTFAWEGNILRIFTKASAPTMTRIFAIQHTNAGDIKPIVDKMLTPTTGACEIDQRTNSLMITDTAAKLSEIKNLLPQIDVKESTVQVTSRPVTEVYYLNYADASTLAAPIKMISANVQIQEFSSSQASQAGAAGEGAAAGGRKDMMIITDTQNNLDRIRELIEKLDMPPIQVTIDAHIYEIDKNEEERLGINWQKSIPIPGSTESLFDISIAPETSDAGGTGVFRFGS